MSDRIKSMLSWVEKGPKGIGKAEYIKFLKGKQITRDEAIKAACYRCSSGWDLGKYCNVDDCPLLQFSPYGEKKDDFSACTGKEILAA